MNRLLVLVVLLAACGSSSVSTTDASDASPDAALAVCPRPSTSVFVYQNCGGAMKDGYRCVFNCGEIPDDGDAGVLIAPECTAEIGTSTLVTGICVASCTECVP